MYITQEADYAMRIITCLAESNVRRDARSISEEVLVTLRFSLKILGKLSAEGIVNSFKGNRGGYELAHKPEEVTMLEVLTAVDGPYKLSRCIKEDCMCNRGKAGRCAVQDVFIDVTEEVNRHLASISFQDILDASEEKKAI